MPPNTSHPLTSDFFEVSRTASEQTILLVDDDEDVRHFVDDTLTKWGYTTIVARSGPEALRLNLFYEGFIDLLLTDFRMPGMSGVEVANEIKIWRPTIKELFMTGYPADALTCRDLDIDAPLLHKPIRLARLKRTLDALLRSER